MWKPPKLLLKLHSRILVSAEIPVHASLTHSYPILFCIVRQKTLYKLPLKISGPPGKVKIYHELLEWLASQAFQTKTNSWVTASFQYQKPRHWLGKFFPHVSVLENLHFGDWYANCYPGSQYHSMNFALELRPETGTRFIINLENHSS